MNETATTAPSTQTNLPLTIHAQYIKDFSFENPNAPAILRPDSDNAAPQMEVNVNLDGKPMEDKGVFEVVLSIKAKATRGSKTMFIAELQYGVVCSVGKNVPEQHIHPLIMIEAPKMAFPFARQILCDAVIGGGFPPLMLNPVDFEGLYVQQYQNEQKSKMATSN
tara:strand:+ start:3892 stop:4386 length:495 start_codon:yes stop_codon:yes gene_type:complete